MLIYRQDAGNGKTPSAYWILEGEMSEEKIDVTEAIVSLRPVDRTADWIAGLVISLLLLACKLLVYAIG